MNILSIIETAYRATLEEQDDTVLWLTQILKHSGADIAVLLRGGAANYAVVGQDSSGLAVGDSKLAHPPRIDDDLKRFIATGGPVFVVDEDMRERGLTTEALIDGIETVRRQGIPALMDRFGQVWHW